MMARRRGRRKRKEESSSSAKNVEEHLLRVLEKSVLPKIERARDAIRSHNDFLFDGSHGGEKNVTSSLEQLSMDFRVKSSLCATTSNALDACAKELVKCANANASRGVRLVPSSS